MIFGVFSVFSLLCSISENAGTLVFSMVSAFFILSFFVDAHQQQLLFIFLFLSLSASQRISFSLFTLLKLQLSPTSIFKFSKFSVLIRCTKGPGSLLPGLFLCHSTMHS